MKSLRLLVVLLHWRVLRSTIIISDIKKGNGGSYSPFCLSLDLGFDGAFEPMSGPSMLS